jgi:hypothetical protein
MDLTEVRVKDLWSKTKLYSFKHEQSRSPYFLQFKDQKKKERKGQEVQVKF